MYIKNVEQVFDKNSELYYCYNLKLKKFLYNIKEIKYISKGKEAGNTYYIFLKTDDLDNALEEWNSKNNK